MSLSSYVMLDRDGVINQDSESYITNREAWLPIPGSLEAIADLNRYGFRVVVITNQSGIARGLLSLKTLADIHEKMHCLVEEHGGKIDGIYFCPHAPNDDCSCRKPKTGLLEDFARNKNIGLKGVPFVGDSFRDIQAGRAVGACSILVTTGNGNETLAKHPDINVPIFENLYEASQFIISGQ